VHWHEHNAWLADIGSLSCHQGAAVLALTGLAVEGFAVLAILWSVGLGDQVKGAARSGRARLHQQWLRFRRWVPWLSDPEPIIRHVKAGEAFSSADRAKTRHTRGEVPAPTSFEEVGKYINVIRQDLNRLEGMHHDETERIDSEMAQLSEQARAQEARLDERINEQVRRTLADRKREGLTFLAGVVLQIVGAVVLLTC
jgi:hypothetical protein